MVSPRRGAGFPHLADFRLISFGPMDPIAHTFVGAALAKSGLEKRSRFAAAALILGANLPDVDGITYFVSGDLGLFFRRGWTHGLPAIAIWPVLLAGTLTLLGRGQARFGALFWLSLLAVLTHPALDWLNTYGMRWLMPLDGTWFYGDAVFIVDAWIWLGLGGALFLVTSRGTLRLCAWILGAILPGYLVLATVPGLLAGKALFVLGLLGLAAARARKFPRTESGGERLNRGALALVATYVVLMVALSAHARRFALETLRAEGHDVQRIMVGPTPITPFTRDVVFATESSYRYGSLLLWPLPRLTLSPEEIPRNESSPLAVRALQEREVRGFATWARFPWASIDEEAEGIRVTLRDARYARLPRSDGFGTAVVILPRSGELSSRTPSPPRAESRSGSP
jgi:inner membrane protein